MTYHSPLSQSRRSILLTGAGIGGLFSLVAILSFGWIDPVKTLVSIAFGSIEGLIISGTGIALQALFPGGTRKRLSRMAIEFLLGASVHALVGVVLLLLAGMQILFLTGITGLLSMVVGELVCARESTILAREEATLARAGQVRLPPAAAGKFGLSARETEVAELLIARASYKDICERLFISLPTVKSHVSAIYRKADVSSRQEFLAAVESLRDTRLT